MNVAVFPSRVGQAKVPTIGPCRHFGRFRRPWSDHVDGPMQSRSYQCLRYRGSRSRLPPRRPRSSVTPATKNRRGKGVDGGVVNAWSRSISRRTCSHRPFHETPSMQLYLEAHLGAVDSRRRRRFLKISPTSTLRRRQHPLVGLGLH